MLTLENHITLDKDTIDSPNLVDRFTDQDLVQIGETVWEAYDADRRSRSDWARRMSAGLDLAMQVQKDKNFPWPGCANIAFPLITVAALQFHSRAYPAMIDSQDIVKCRVIGPDPTGQKSQRAERVSCHMSWQLMEQDKTWESQVDRQLLYTPIAGACFKKSYFDGGCGHNKSDLVFARDLVINYWARFEENPVKTHIIPLTKNKIYSRVKEGIFKDVLECEWYTNGAEMPIPNAEDAEEDNRHGLTRPQADERTPFIGLEQHTNLDLDGDGYAEPYIVTIEESTHEVLRIVCRFEREEDIDKNDKGEIIRIHATEYFTKVPFIPSPDGGIYDIGFGVLLGPLNESVNSIINQLVDAGTIANTSGGFLGRGAKIRGGVYNFSPFQWNRVDSTGDDLKKSIFPLPVREPSNVLFQLLSLLISYTEKVSGATEMSTGGNPGQNTPASTSNMMVEQGQKVYAAIFKRQWRAMKWEFEKLYQLNALNLPPGKIYFAGTDQYITKGDYLGDPSSVIPVADPNIMSDQQKFMQASVIAQRAQQNPAYDKDEVEKLFLRSLKVPNIDVIYKGIKNAPPPKPDVKVQVEQMKMQVQLKNLEWKKLQYMSSLFEQRRLNEAKIVELYAQAALYEKQAGGIEAANNIAMFQTVIDTLKTAQEGINSQLELLGQEDEQGTENSGGTPSQTPGGNGGAGVPQLAGPSSNKTLPQLGA